LRAQHARREISVSTAAEIAGCSTDTVLRWIEEGAIAARRISPRGWWKVETDSLDRYLQRMAEGSKTENTANAARKTRRVA
jgi:excisionase family DNA binding protein